MSSGNTTVPSERGPRASAAPENRLVPTLTIECAVTEPGRTAESTRLGKGESFLGRANSLFHNIFERVGAGEKHPTGALNDPGVSRDQVRFEVTADCVEFWNIGNATLRHNGHECAHGELEDGDDLELVGHYAFLFTMEPASIPACKNWPFKNHKFGERDPIKMTGESAYAWSLRETLATAALMSDHVFLNGESGVGKELAAEGIHTMSARAKGPYVPFNVSAMAEGTIDGELFGNRKDWPQKGMPASLGLLAGAENGTVFLDEIGDMSQMLQSRLLRALEGSIRPLGEQPRSCNFRGIAATNRPTTALSDALFGRFTLKIDILPLNRRRVNIGLLIRDLVRAAAVKNPRVAGPFLRNVDGHRPQIAIETGFVAALLRHNYTRNIRELQAILAQSFLESPGDVLVKPKGVFTEKRSSDTDVTPEEVRAEVERQDGNQTQAAKKLGISRWVLRGLLKK